LIDYEQVAGDCGKRPSQTTVLHGDPTSVPYPCQGRLDSSTNHCAATFEIHCPVKDDTGTTLSSIERGALNWNPAGDLAQGHLDLSLFQADGDLQCQSSYRTSVRKQ
jgi:hypothetical protein